VPVRERRRLVVGEERIAVERPEEVSAMSAEGDAGDDEGPA